MKSFIVCGLLCVACGTAGSSVDAGFTPIEAESKMDANLPQETSLDANVPELNAADVSSHDAERLQDASSDVIFEAGDDATGMSCMAIGAEAAPCGPIGPCGYRGFHVHTCGPNHTWNPWSACMPYTNCEAGRAD